MYSHSIENLIRSFKKLPTVGPRMAERFVFYLLKSGKKDASQMALALKELLKNIKSCRQCWDFSDTNPCPLCQDNRRRRDSLCVVSEPQDIPVIEKTKEYNGLYFVLRGLIETASPEQFEKTKIKELLERTQKDAELKEIILALNPDLNGETTIMYLRGRIKKINPNIKITRLVRGLPTGSDLKYADEITLSSALKNRIEE